MSPAGRPSAAAIAARRGWGKDGSMTEAEWHRKQWLDGLESGTAESLAELRDVVIRDHAARVAEIEENLGRLRSAYARNLGEIDAAIRRKEREAFNAKLRPG